METDNNNNSPKLGRDTFFMAVAELARLKSHDPRLKVGCCIVDSETRQILGIGYNGFLQGAENEADLWNSSEKKYHLLHAEANGLTFCAPLYGRSVTAYVTCLPCENCALTLIQKRFDLVVYNVFAKKYEQPSFKYFENGGVDVACLADIAKKPDQFLTFQEALDEIKKNEPYEKLHESDCLKKVPKRLIDSWDQLYMSLACLAENRCSGNLKGGCCIVRDNKLLVFGFAGLPQAFRHKDLPADFDTPKAERDAIKNAFCFADDVAFSTLYSSTVPTENAVLEAGQRRVSLLIYRQKEGEEDVPAALWMKARKKNLTLVRWSNEIPLYVTPTWENLSDDTVSYGCRPGEESLRQNKTEEQVLQDINEHNDQTPKSYRSIKKKNRNNAWDDDIEDLQANNTSGFQTPPPPRKVRAQKES